jgi:hypothetical protein
LNHLPSGTSGSVTSQSANCSLIGGNLALCDSIEQDDSAMPAERFAPDQTRPFDSGKEASAISSVITHH